MFEIYSVNLQHMVNAEDVTDLSDNFKCPNCDCNALYTLKAIDSTVRHKYFGRRKSTPHIQGCPYNNETHRYLDDGNIIKYSVNDIFSKTPPKNANHKCSSDKPTIGSASKLKYVRTAKQLFNYCISNSIYTIYQNGITVGDIFLDERNIYFNGNFQGRDGLYFVLAKTYKYYSVSNSIETYLSTKTPNGKTVSLHIRVFLSKKHFNEIVKYILDTFHNFSGHSIAILGNWDCYEKYHIQCNASLSNVIYKFVDEV